MFNSLKLAAFAAPLSLLACATPESDAPVDTADGQVRSCFFISQVNGFNDAPEAGIGSDRIIVNVGVNDKYLFETFGSCPDLNWSETIAFDQRGPGRICQGLDVDLIVPTSIGPQRCPVRMIRKVSEAEIEAMKD
ncbi:DUF6491 family protein [Parasphingorhabdus sp.]|uniref:DUF6491 family protein n=1 Tax=Parasphingorhabdus sp. TaxID=2709688 RepID=UPI003003109C